MIKSIKWPPPGFSTIASTFNFFYISQVNLSTISNDHVLNKDWPYQSRMILYLETLYSAAPNLLVARDWFCRRTGGVCFHTLPGFNMCIGGALLTGGPVLGGHGPQIKLLKLLK